MKSPKQLYRLLLTIIAVLVFGMAGAAYATNKMLASEANKLISLKAKDQALSKEQVSFAKAKQDLKKYEDLHKITQAVVPEDKNQAAAVREIVNIAATNNVSLASITFPASTLGSNVPKPGAATSPAAAATDPKAALSQLQPVKNIPGVYELLITVQSDPDKPVQYDRFIGFLQSLERNRRTAQVSTIILQPDTKNPNLLTFTLTLKEYIKP